MQPHLSPYRRSRRLLAFPLLAGLGLALKGWASPSLLLPFRLPRLAGIRLAGTLAFSWRGVGFPWLAGIRCLADPAKYVFLRIAKAARRLVLIGSQRENPPQKNDHERDHLP